MNILSQMAVVLEVTTVSRNRDFRNHIGLLPLSCKKNRNSVYFFESSFVKSRPLNLAAEVNFAVVNTCQLSQPATVAPWSYYFKEFWKHKSRGCFGPNIKDHLTKKNTNTLELESFFLKPRQSLISSLSRRLTQIRCIEVLRLIYLPYVHEFTVLCDSVLQISCRQLNLES